MSRRSLALTVLLFIPTVAAATPVVLSFTAITQTVQTGGLLPPIGTVFNGTLTYDYDPASYVAGTNNVIGPNYASYEYSSLPYGLSVQVGNAIVPPSLLAVEVFDDGPQSILSSFPSDTVTLGTQYLDVSYRLFLTGPDSTFTGTAIPTPDQLLDLSTSRTFVVNDRADNARLTAVVTSLSIRAVPEPSVLLLVGVGFAAGSRRRRPVG